MVYKPQSTDLRTSKIKMAPTTYEYFALVVLLPLATTSYLYLNHFTTVPGPALFLPIILFVFFGLAFLVTNPSQYLTAISIVFELTGITIFGLFYDFADLRKCPSPYSFYESTDWHTQAPLFLSYF
jgi:sugar phosphate permease